MEMESTLRRSKCCMGWHVTDVWGQSMAVADLIYDTSIALTQSNEIIIAILLDVAVECSAFQFESFDAPRTL